MINPLPSKVLPTSVVQLGSQANQPRPHTPTRAFGAAQQQAHQQARQIGESKSQEALPSKPFKRFRKPQEALDKSTKRQPAWTPPIKQKQSRKYKKPQPQPNQADPELLKAAARRVIQQDSRQQPAPQHDNTPIDHGKGGSNPPTLSTEGKDGWPHPAKLNKLIIAAASIEDILGLYAVHKHGFNVINLTTAFYRMARKLKAFEPQRHIEAKKQALQKHPEMQELTTALIGKMHECDAWGLINICWAQGAMSLGSTKVMRKVIQLVSERSRAESEYIPAKELYVVVWGAAKQGFLTQALWDHFSPRLTASVSWYSLPALSNVLWASASQGFIDDAAFITAAAAATIRQKINLSDQSLANVAWSFAKLNYFEGGLWGVLTSQGLSNIPHMSDTDLGMYVWATTQRLKADAAVSGLDLHKQTQTLVYRKSFISQGDRATLLNALRNRLGQLLEEKKVTPRVLAMSLSAMSSIGYYSPSLMDAAADYFVVSMPSLKFQPMVSLIWACSGARHYHPKFFQACAAKVLSALADPSARPTFAPLTVSILVYAFATHTIDPEDQICMEMVRQLCDRAFETLDTFDVQALTNTAWGFAVLGHLHPPFFRRVRAIAPTKLHLLKLEELSQLYQLELILRLEAPDLGLDLSHLTRYEDIFAALQARGELAGLARSRWQQLKDPARLAPSVFQKDIAAATTILSLPHTIELEYSEEEYTVDMAFPEARVVVEADGPLHFMRNERRATGRTIVKRRSLQQLGWTVLSIPYFHWDHLNTFTQKMAYMEGCLSQVGIHTLPVPAALQHLEEHQNASSKRHRQEFDKIRALLGEREQLGLVCRPFPAKLSVHEQDEAPYESYTDSRQHVQHEALPESYTRTRQQNKDPASLHSCHLNSQPQTQGSETGHSYPDSQQQEQVDAMPESYIDTQQPKQGQATIFSYRGSQRQKQDETLSESYSQLQKRDETSVESSLESQQQTHSQTPVSSYLDRQQQQQQQQDEAAIPNYLGSQQQKQDAAPTLSYLDVQQQREDAADSPGHAESQQPNVAEAVSQPQRLSRSQQQALLRKKTGKAPQSRLELILQVAKNRKEAAAQNQAFHDVSAPGS